MTRKKQWHHKALVLGRIGIVRSLGREGIQVALAREGSMVFERASRYCQEFIYLPSLVSNLDKALEVLEQYGERQDVKPVAFFNGESDVLFFSKYRKRLGEYFRIILAPHDLIISLIDKAKFAKLAEKHDLPVPKTIIPQTQEDFFKAAERVGYPCILKPISQRRWHTPEIINAIGLCKAMLINGPEELKGILKILPRVDGREMVQEYIPGDDQQHFDFHAYLDRMGNPRGALVGHKIRTYPIHFGQGCYTHYVEEPRVANTCLESLRKIGYTGAANINVKRHAETRVDYILEINPRFSLWTIIDSRCGVNLPLLLYYDAVGSYLPVMKPHGAPRRWLWFGSDIKAMNAYWACGELTPWQWLRSFFTQKGEIEFHVFSWDDPLPLVAYWWISIRSFWRRLLGFLKRCFVRILGGSREP